MSNRKCSVNPRYQYLVDTEQYQEIRDEIIKKKEEKLAQKHRNEKIFIEQYHNLILRNMRENFTTTLTAQEIESEEVPHQNIMNHLRDILKASGFIVRVREDHYDDIVSITVTVR